MADSLDVNVLSDDQVALIDAEIAKLYGITGATPTKPIDHTNKALESLFRNYGSEKRNNTGKVILSSRTFKEMLKQGLPFNDEYIMVQSEDGSVASVPARKHVKYLGEGRRLVEDEDLAPQKPESTKEVFYIDGKAHNVFFCSNKYPDCTRFFDSNRGRITHQKADHEQAWGKKTRGKYAQQGN